MIVNSIFGRIRIMRNSQNNQPPEKSNEQISAELQTNDIAEDNNSNPISFDIRDTYYVQDSEDGIHEIIFPEQQE